MPQLADITQSLDAFINLIQIWFCFKIYLQMNINYFLRRNWGISSRLKTSKIMFFVQILSASF